MQVLLLRPYPKNSVCSSVPPLGLGYVAAALLRAGIEVEILDRGNRTLGEAEFRARLRGARPDLVGVQVHSRDVDQSAEMIRETREVVGDRVPIVVGGPHPSGMPTEVFDHLPGIDYAIVGEGEWSLPLLARHVAGDPSVAREAIPGLAWRADGRVAVNPPVFPDDLDALGFPAWDVMRLAGYRTEVFGGGFTRRTPAMTMLTSRGCPYRCAFCVVGALCGPRLRLRDPERVVEEMHQLRDGRGFQELKILDDNFNADRRHVLAIGEAFRRRPADVSISFACGLHLHGIDDEVLDVLQSMGAYELMVAIESGSPRVLGLMNKNVDLGTVAEKIATIRRHGLGVAAFFIIGFPGETPEEIERTVRLSLALPLDRAHYNCFSPVPGSEIYDELRAAGRLEDFDARYVHFETIHYSFVEGLSPARLNRLRQKALLRFYLRPRVLLGLARVFRRWTSAAFLARKAAEYFGLVK